MSKKELLTDALNNNGGIIRTADAVSAGVSKAYFMEYVKSNELEKVSQGIYASKDAWLDGMYLLQMRFKRTIFSHETALYLHDLAEREPFRYTVTVTAKYHSSALKEQGVKVYSVKPELYELGIYRVQTPFGHEVAAYDLERTILDIIRNKRNIEVQDFSYALNQYVMRRDKNLHRLMNYAKALRMEDALRTYMEILL